MISADELREFQGYLDNCTNEQVLGVYIKELQGDRKEYAFLAAHEAQHRGLHDEFYQVSMEFLKGASDETQA